MVTTTGGTLNAQRADPPLNDGQRLRLLGVVELTGPFPQRFLPERRFRLLAYLAVQGTWVPRDQLAHVFWPDRAQGAARNNLRKLLFEVRALNLAALEDSRHALRWQIDHDVMAFEQAKAREDHQTVLTLYQGTPLQGLDGGDSPAFAAWLRSERMRLRTTWREAVLATVRGAVPQTAVELSGRLLNDDPYDEEAVRLQMRALAALGRNADVTRTYRSFAERITEDFGVEAAIETRDLARHLQPGAQIQSESLPDSLEASDGFVGRRSELAELLALVRDPQCRLITVTGPGGMGKSRLVKEVVRRLSARSDENVCWIALDDLTDIGQVVPRVARELGLAITGTQDAAEVVSGHLAPLNKILVFDNSEHLPRLGALISSWLDAAPKLKVVATSRARIGLPGEWLLTLRGLEVPADENAEGGLDTEAARLFVGAARLAQPRFKATGEARHVVRLVRAMGGLPLAILLAASWVRLLPMADMVSDLSRLLEVLEQAEDGDERPEHRSVRATFEQSWRLLSPAEQQLLMVLSVFAGAFSRAAVHDVSQAPLPVLGSLIDKSLVQIDDAARCSLHPLIQQFAAQKLEAEPVLKDSARDQHAASYARLMAQFGHFNSIDQAAALRTINIELPNILAAWQWGIVRRSGDWLGSCASGLSNFYQARGPINVGLDLFARAEVAINERASAADDAAWGIPLELASLNYWIGNYPAVEAAGRRALAAARARRNAYAIRFSLNTVGLALLRLGRVAEAERFLMEALKRARAENLPDEIASFAGNLVGLKRELGDSDGAYVLAMEALEGHRRNGHTIGEISMRNELGLLHDAAGKPAEAIVEFETGARLAEEMGLTSRRATLLGHSAGCLLACGEIDRARELGLEALRIMLETRSSASQPTCRRNLVAIELAAGHIDAAREHLLAAIEISRTIATEVAIAPTLRDGAIFLEQHGDAVLALRLVACASAHRPRHAHSLDRYTASAARLEGRFDAAITTTAVAAGAHLSLGAALDELERAVKSAST